MEQGTVCRDHPTALAECVCADCRASICGDCARTWDDGTIVCWRCAAASAPPADRPSAGAGAARAAGTGVYDLAPSTAVQSIPPVLAYGRQNYGNCRNHPDLTAIAVCTKCGAPVCATCVFAFAGGVQLCPDCATDTKVTLSSKRKALFGWSVALGGLGLLGFMGLVGLGLAGFFTHNPDAEPLDVCGTLGSLATAVAGLITGLVALDKRVGNPGYLWIGPLLGGLACLIWLGLMVVGVMMKMG